MDVLLSELIARTNDGIRPLEHSPSTVYQYQLAWRALADYFLQHDRALFSRPLAEQYLLESKAKLAAGVIKPWRHKLNRRAVDLLIECFASGQVTWKYHADQPAHLHEAAYQHLQAEYLHHLHVAGKGAGTVQTYGLVARQFLEYLEQRAIPDVAQVGRNQISAFIPFISKRYQAASMGTVLAALRSFLRYVADRHLTPIDLSSAIPDGGARTTQVISPITLEETQTLLATVDRTTASGKRNYAMLLLALRLGLRSIDIVQLKRGDIDWRRQTIEIVQAKTATRLVLPLLAEVGNALADYLLYGRPPSPQPYVFLRSQAPYRRLASHSTCYGICRKLMAQAGIRPGPGAPRGFHCLRHAVATRLLAAGTPLPTISSILGHRHKNSTQRYLSTDLEHLRAVALSLTGIEITREELR